MSHRVATALFLTAAWLVKPCFIEASDKAEAGRVLTESYGFAKNIDFKERGYYLARLTQVAAKISFEKTEDWTNEQFKLAEQMSPEWNVIATKKNALKALACISPQEALEKLSALPAPPYPDPKVAPPEDLRADAAVVIFPCYWRAVGLPGLSALETAATQMGTSGEYPYRAMLYIMEQLSRDLGDQQRDEIERIFSDAVSAYRRGGTYADADEQFLGMLENAQFVVSEPRIVGALHTLIDNLLNNVGKTDPNFQESITTAKGSFNQFKNKSELLLFRAFPLVVKFDDDLTTKLRTDYARIVRDAGDDIEDIQQGIIEGPAGQEQIQQLQQQVVQNASIAKIDSLKEANPWAALELARNLPSPSLRFVNVSAILASMVIADPKQARAVYSMQLEDIKKLDGDTAARLSAEIGLAKAAFYVQDMNTFSDLTIKAFTLGAELFDQNRGQLATRRPGYNDLIDLAKFCTEHGAMWILDTIRQIQDPLLKSYLLVYAAEGIAEQKPTLQPVDALVAGDKLEEGNAKQQAKAAKPH